VGVHQPHSSVYVGTVSADAEVPLCVVGKDARRPVNVRFFNGTSFSPSITDYWKFVLKQYPLGSPKGAQTLAYRFTSTKPLGAGQWTLLTKAGKMLQDAVLVMSLKKEGSPSNLTDFCVTFSLEGGEEPW